jgi:hypothetical protein
MLPNMDVSSLARSDKRVRDGHSCDAEGVFHENHGMTMQDPGIHSDTLGVHVFAKHLVWDLGASKPKTIWVCVGTV